MDTRTERLLTPVMEALTSRNSKASVLRFQEVIAHAPDLRNVDLAVWLAESIGKQQTELLVHYYARYPCMGCKKGLLKCEHCDSHGVLSDGEVCERCLGLRAMNCDFCAGSGWITYSFVPPGLVAAVLLERIRLVLAEAKDRLASPPEPEDSSPADRAKSLAGEMLQFNRLLGVMDNGLAVVSSPPPPTRKHGNLLKKVRAACLHGADKVIRRVRRDLTQLAEVWAAKAVRGNNRPAAKRLANFYHRLSASEDFSGTGLYHVYLSKAARGQSTK